MKATLKNTAVFLVILSMVMVVLVAVDTASLRLFNQVKQLDLAAAAHIGKGEALHLGTTQLDSISIKRIKI